DSGRQHADGHVDAGTHVGHRGDVPGLPVPVRPVALLQPWSLGRAARPHRHPGPGRVDRGHRRRRQQPPRERPSRHPSHIWGADFGGFSCYLLGHVAVWRRAIGRWHLPRASAAVAILALWPAAAVVPPLLALGTAVAVLGALVAWELTHARAASRLGTG